MVDRGVEMEYCASMAEISSLSDNHVTQEELAAVERLLSQLQADNSPALAVVSQFLLVFKMFRNLDSRLPFSFERNGTYHTILSGMLFLSSCTEEIASKSEDSDLRKIGASQEIVKSVARYIRERYQLWFGLRDEEAASLIADKYLFQTA